MNEKELQQQRVFNGITRKLADEGQLIEGGWRILAATFFRTDSVEAQDALRMAYYAGAQHVFTSIMSMLDAGEDATPKDMDRMTKVHNELEAWAKETKLRIAPAKGNG